MLPKQVTQDMKWKYLYNQLGLSSQITSASYSLKMAYKKHLYPFEEHQRNKKGGRDDKKGNNGEEDDSAAPDQSGDEESGSISSGKSSSNGEPESDSNAGPPDDLPDHNSQSDEAMDTTNRYDNCLMNVELVSGELVTTCVIISECKFLHDGFVSLH